MKLTSTAGLNMSPGPAAELGVGEEVHQHRRVGNQLGMNHAGSLTDSGETNTASVNVEDGVCDLGPCIGGQDGAGKLFK